MIRFLTASLFEMLLIGAENSFVYRLSQRVPVINYAVKSFEKQGLFRLFFKNIFAPGREHRREERANGHFSALFLRNSGRKHLRFRRFCGTLYSRREDENLKSRSRLGTSAFRRVE